ncbi:pyridoxal phosphate-dependent aminotransferase [Marinimicrococcus flavescens]|uniref:aspartate transaminase n=1 Tax=Marinimicrococcus flavescens TaxID=3031815 RepID=A0AAP3V0W3_9PROT|nr:aminotransferase class I/II-fold pyridoxal phosphate-dependent enzyme [Marinimicrococcus flavescens]
MQETSHPGPSRPSPSRRSGIAPFIVMEVLAAANARAAAGADVLHLEVGEPGGGAPEQALAAARAALGAGPLGYTEALGIPPLRARIARHYREAYDLAVPEERIVATAGASGAFVLAFLAAFDAGQRVALAEPCYPAYRNILQALDIEVVPLPAEADSRFQPTVELLERVEGPIHGLIVASPANPTGSMLDAASLERLASWCRARGVRLIADEIYHGITYEQPAQSVLATMPEAVVVNSFSKYFCMTGWRLGWMVVPEDLVAPVTRLAQNLFISPSTVAQHAALGAFEAREELEGRIARYRRNRDVLLAALHRAGIERIAPPDGAFYLYADIAELGMDSRELCRLLLEETGVAVTPGLDFDASRGHRFIRLSFAGEEQAVATAADRLASWLTARRPGARA